MHKRQIIILFLFFMIFQWIIPLTASCKEKLHPINKPLIQAGLMPYPKYYPSVPRVMANVALSLYQTGRAKIAHIGDDGEVVMGAYDYRENEVGRIPKEIKLAKGQILLLY